jgi:hypothetical protein
MVEGYTALGMIVIGVLAGGAIAARSEGTRWLNALTIAIGIAIAVAVVPGHLFLPEVWRWLTEVPDPCVPDDDPGCRIEAEP